MRFLPSFIKPPEIIESTDKIDVGEGEIGNISEFFIFEDGKRYIKEKVITSI
jgi:hypothetical protein